MIFGKPPLPLSFLEPDSKHTFHPQRYPSAVADFKKEDGDEVDPIAHTLPFLNYDPEIFEMMAMKISSI